jgi:hypothetical protein
MRSMVDLLGLLLIFELILPKIPAAAETGYIRLRMVEIPDEQGFERPVVALRFLAPPDWRIEGGVRWNLPLQCPAELATVHVRAIAPTGDLGFEILPSRVWRWSDDPTEVDYWRTGAGPGNQCAIAPPMTAADFLAESLPGTFRPPFEVVAIEPLPEMAAALATEAQQLVAMNAPFRTDAARLRVRYDEGATEEWLTAGVLQMALQVMSSGAAMQGRMEMTTQYISSASRVFGFRAPAGRLDEQKRLFATMVASVQVNPAWDAALNRLALNLAQIQIQSAAERSRIWSEAAAEVSRIRMAAWENQQASQDRIAAAWSQTIRGVETFVDPGDASQVELQSGFDNAWSNGVGEYVLSDRPSFNPNTVFTNQNWTRMERRP